MTELEAANARLKASRARCSIQLRGTRYALVATLPLRDAPGRKQQRISLRVTSLFEAERLAVQLNHELETHTFTWESWTEPPEPDLITVDRFREIAAKVHASKYKRDPERGQKTWTKNWLPALRKLPKAGAVTEKTLLGVVDKLPENGSSRRNQGSILAQIAEELSIPTRELRKASAGYGASALKPRDIPKDEAIETLVLETQIPHWRWVLGMMAAYGLRPHELEEITPSEDMTWIVADRTKTGTRQVHPCPSAWFELFDLGRIRRPPASNQEMSARVSAHLRDRGYPFNSYNLRHAYAIRLMEKGVPPELGCRLMGHSLQTHERTYKRWLERDRVAKALSRFDL